MKNLLIVVILATFGTVAFGQTPVDESALPSTGITYQNGQGSNNTVNWTYIYGAKLSVFGSVSRNFEIMNTSKGESATLAFRTYDSGVPGWRSWKEMLYQEQSSDINFEFNSTFANNPILRFENEGDNADIWQTFYRWSGDNNKYWATRFERSSTGFHFLNSNSADMGSHTFTDRLSILNDGSIETGGSLTVNSENTSNMVAEISKSIDDATQFNIRHGAGLAGEHLYTLGTNSAKNFIIRNVTYNSGGAGDLLRSDPTTNDLSILPSSGNVGIGTVETFGYKLAVNGTVGAKEVKVELSSEWPDYVFNESYNLKPLEDLEKFISTNKHLPEIPTAKEVTENGVLVGEMSKMLLEKVEELTLYLIEQNKMIEAQQKELQYQRKEIEALKKSK